MNAVYRDTLTDWLQAASPKATQPTDLDTIASRGSELLTLLAPLPDERIAQGIAIANELLPTTTDPKLVLACLIHPQLQALGPEHWPDELKQHPDLRSMALGVSRLAIQEKIEGQSTEARLAQSAALRKMLLAMVDDIRVVIIKLCEQTAEVRQLHKHPDPSKRWQAEMGLHVYASLANRLGLGQLKWVLEDLSFRYLEPDTYKDISKSLQHKRTEREAYIVNFKQKLQDLISDNTDCQQFEVSGRVKHIYSIYRKCKRKNHSYAEINDATALRVLLPTIADCYAALSAIHSTWDSVPDEFDDYISNPKPNGYRSLHTVIVGPEDRQVEIQLRTFDMHEEAELGVAAHWKYKEARSSNAQNTNSKINWLQNLLSWQEEVDTDRDKSLYREVFQNRVYVFTPNNKVMDLPPGSTPLDFAYYIHTDIGHHCVGAKANGRIVPLSYQLLTGDQVEILTQKNSSPSRDWLSKKSGYLGSRQARTKVRNYFRKEFYQDYVKKGQEIWEKHLAKESISKKDLQQLLAIFNFNKQDDLLCNLGSQDLNIRTVINKLRSITGVGEQLVSIKKPSPKPSLDKADSAIVIEGVSNLLTQLARCCRPIPGDEVKGYVTKSTGVSIHRMDCDNLQYAMQHKPERIVDAQWGIKGTTCFPTVIEIISANDAQTDKKIVSYMVSQDAAVQRHSSQINRTQSTRIYQYHILVHDLDQLTQIINGVRSISGVAEVRRI
jgi:GTP pyrophosphokinase